jgi:hypothetical protein
MATKSSPACIGYFDDVHLLEARLPVDRLVCLDSRDDVRLGDILLPPPPPWHAAKQNIRKHEGAARLQDAVGLGEELCPGLEVECRLDTEEMLKDPIGKRQVRGIHAEEAAAGRIVLACRQLLGREIDADHIRGVIVLEEVSGGGPQPTGDFEDLSALVGNQGEELLHQSLTCLLLTAGLCAPITIVIEVTPAVVGPSYQPVHEIVVQQGWVREFLHDYLPRPGHGLMTARPGRVSMVWGFAPAPEMAVVKSWA